MEEMGLIEKSGEEEKPRRQKKAKSPVTTVLSTWLKFRRGLGLLLAWFQESDAFLYAMKFTFGVMLLSWPAFVASWANWYYGARGGEFS